VLHFLIAKAIGAQLVDARDYIGAIPVSLVADRAPAILGCSVSKTSIDESRICQCDGTEADCPTIFFTGMPSLYAALFRIVTLSIISCSSSTYTSQKITSGPSQTSHHCASPHLVCRQLNTTVGCQRHNGFRVGMTIIAVMMLDTV
jgi:hypothetical protein